MSLTLAQIRDDLFGKVEIRDVSESSTLYTNDALRAVNWALQIMWLSPFDHFKQEESYVVALTVGVSEYALDSNVQRVLGNVRLTDGTTLAPIVHRADLDNFGIFYGGNDDNDIAQGKPIAFYLERYRGVGNDLAAVKIIVTPEPDQSYTLNMDVERECPRYSAFDNTVLAVPHQYTESIFLPLARYAMSRSDAFINEASYGRFQSDFQQALSLLGMSDATIPAVNERANK
jgi:hypothetical protein